jgi:DNA-binding CsgD family transcriptional regulator/tetratricopeptide (TPR) repeat protein
VVQASADTGATLLEREGELATLRAALGDAAASVGRAVLVCGPPGIGKTALLCAAKRLARAQGLAVLAARASELEGHFPYGVVRQLFEPALRQVAASEQEGLFLGPARMALPVLGVPKPGPAGTGQPQPAKPHTALARSYGLYWLAVNLSQRCPQLVLVDDLQWADRASARFLLFLLRRLEGLPIALVAAARTDDRGNAVGAASELAGEPLWTTLWPASFSEQAVARIVASGLGRTPGHAFALACRDVTGGAPLLVHELVGALASRRVQPTDDNVAAVKTSGPRAVARGILTGGALSGGPLASSAMALARAVAVLGRHADLPRAARLSDLEGASALRALDALVAGHVLKVGPREGTPGSGAVQPGSLDFVHPIVSAAVYGEIPLGERSALHHKAASFLRSEGADKDAVAAHLLASEPTGSSTVAATLSDAAASALERGAPEDAVAYLSRALQEVGESERRATVLFELARAERLAGQASAVAHFREARRLAKEPVLRNRAAFELAGVLAMSGEWGAPIAIAEEAVRDLAGRAPDLTERLERLLAGCSAYDPRLVAEFDRRLPALRELARRTSQPARAIALLLATIDVLRDGEGPGDAARLGRDWSVDGLVAAGMEEWGVSQGLAALAFSEELQQALDVTEALLASAKSRGALFAVFTGLAYRGLVEARRGNLVAAEQELRAALEPARERGFAFAVPSVLWFATEVVVERPEAADFAALAEQFELGPMAAVASGALLLDMRGRARHAAGDTRAGVDDLRRAGEVYTALGFSNPNPSNWRSALAIMMRRDQPDEAHRLANEELDDARRVGLARGIGAALRALGLIEGGVAGRYRLEEAVKTLDGSPARLEHARALVDLGAALRRNGERAAARKPLLAGLDRAVEFGATRLAGRARQELAAAGARPRRLRATGPESLTPSELRVARLAAEGRTNVEIAQVLFVTPKTVDTHLSHVYSKLGISSRQALAASLGSQETGSVSR